jgi:hypothetical protein
VLAHRPPVLFIGNVSWCAQGSKRAGTRPVRLCVGGIRSRKSAQQASTVYQILFLEIGEVDLTLAGLHAFLRAANPDEPIRLRLQADDTGGILGRLFCQLAQSKAVLATQQQARHAARVMTRHMHRTTILRAAATIYAPNHSSGTGLASSTHTCWPTSVQSCTSCSGRSTSSCLA